MSLATRFYALFQGLDRAHGIYTEQPGAVAPGAKAKGQARTERTPPTVELWEQHLAGSVGLGIIPIRDDATCRFGAFDIDVYPLDLEHLAREVAALGLPIILCRSKSGGAHGYCFTSEPVPAALLRERLMEWAIALGHAGVEVFPKHSRLASRNDVSNWINLPYQGGERSLRYAIDAKGGRLPPSTFLDVAEAGAISLAALEKFTLKGDDAFIDGPPCLQSLAKSGFPKGSMNNGLFSIAVYLRKRYGDGWDTRLDIMNQRYMTPGSASEVQGIIKSIGKKEYEYKCQEQPICAVCNRQICLTRKYGVGAGDDNLGVVFGEIVKLTTTPPTWIWDVNGARIELATEDLMLQARFQKRCLEELNRWPLPIKLNRWRALVQERLDRAEVVEVPVDATDAGYLLLHLQRYCTGHVQARGLDELLLNKPFTDRVAKRVYFTGADFMHYLEQQRVRGVGLKDLYRWLRKVPGHEHHFFNLKGKGVNCWSLPAFPEQTEPFTVPQPKPPEV